MRRFPCSLCKRRTLVNKYRCQRMPHFVRTNAVFQVTATRYPFENVLDLVNRHSMRSPHRHEQGSIIVASFMEITLQPDARTLPRSKPHAPCCLCQERSQRPAANRCRFDSTVESRLHDIRSAKKNSISACSNAFSCRNREAIQVLQLLGLSECAARAWARST